MEGQHLYRTTESFFHLENYFNQCYKIKAESDQNAFCCNLLGITGMGRFLHVL